MPLFCYYTQPPEPTTRWNAMPQGKKNREQNQSPDFEKSLAELEKIVQRMEQGEQSMEQTMKDFERGMVLSEQCRKSLETARQRVDKLVAKQGEVGDYALQPLDQHDAQGAE